MTPFYGDNKNLKILSTVNGKTFYWKIDTGSAVTCMNINSFETAFGKKKEEQKEYKTDIFIKKRKCSHTVQITDELSENILGIDFLQKFRLHLDPKTQQMRRIRQRRQHKSEQQILLFLQTSGPPTGRMPETNEGKQTLSRCTRSILLAQDLRHGRQRRQGRQLHRSRRRNHAKLVPPGRTQQ